MARWGRRERSADEVEAKAAEEALRDSVDELRAEHQDVERTIQQANDALQKAERERAKRVEQAQKHLETVSSNPKILGIGGVLARKAELYDITVKVPEGHFELEPSIRARVETSGRKTQSYDTRQLLLLIGAAGWASTISLNPDTETQAAHQFAQTINIRAQSMSTIHAQRAENIAAAERELAAQRADRQAVTVLRRRLIAAIADGHDKLRAPRTVVEMNIERVDPDGRAARKAKQALQSVTLRLHRI